MHEIFAKYARNMREICAKYARNIRETRAGVEEQHVKALAAMDLRLQREVRPRGGKWDWSIVQANGC
jgi:hypothetical protein